MSNVSNSQTKFKPVFRAIVKGMPTLLVLGLVALGWLAVHEINAEGEPAGEDGDATTQEVVPHTLSLPRGKMETAGFESLPAQSQTIERDHTVPGRIRYDESKHIGVKAPMDGILAEVLATPGDRVETGQLLAVLRSPEIGKARAEVLRQQAQREIAAQIFKREKEREENLLELFAMLDKRQSIEAIESTFSDRALGNYRQELISAYSQLQLATEILAKIQPLAGSGSIAGRTIREREAALQIAATAFSTACDQASFAARQSRTNAEANLAHAERQLNLALQTVETLLGYQDHFPILDINNDEALSQLEIRAPFAGSVESRSFATKERITAGETLLVLANTESLYVAASIREGDWCMVSLNPGMHVLVNVPALSDREYLATVKYLGREVESNTNAVPLIATIDNRDGRLRPGMFVRVRIPLGQPRQALAVKPESVVQHENQQFVFVDLQGGNFQRVDVLTGQTSENWVEVTQGLAPGQLVVTEGAFLLKSELLLQGQAE